MVSVIFARVVLSCGYDNSRLRKHGETRGHGFHFVGPGRQILEFVNAFLVGDGAFGITSSIGCEDRCADYPCSRRIGDLSSNRGGQVLVPARP